MSMNQYYAVKVGRKPGVYYTWAECKKQVDKFPNADFKKFDKEKDAISYVNSSSNISSSQSLGSDELIAYIDGSYFDGVYGAGAVVLTNSGEKHLSLTGDCQETATMHNVAGELLAARSVISYAIENKFKKIIIFYDYLGIEKWADGSWRATKKQTIEYRNFIYNARKKIAIEFQHVKDHSGNQYNDLADKLAKQAVFEYKRQDEFI